MARRSALGRAAGAAALTAIVVAAVALAVLAIQHGRPPASAATARPVPTFEIESPSPTPTPTPSAPTADRFLSVGAAAAWRATSGACDGTSPVIEWSGDDGLTWTDVTPEGIGAVRSLTSFGGVNATAVVDAASACDTVALSSFTSGAYWQTYDNLFAAASYLTADPGQVVVAGDAIAAPCSTPRNLRVDGTIALLCEDVAYARSGTEWNQLATGVVALAVDPAGVVTAARTDACAGIELTRYDGQTGGTPACLTVADPAAPLAIDLDQGEVVAWSGDEVARLSR